MQQFETRDPTSNDLASAETGAGVVMFLDMVSYSHQIELDEAGTLDFMGSCFDTIRNLALRYEAELIKTIGDGALLLFTSAEPAVRFGVEFHRVVAKLQQGAETNFRFRVGIHLGPIFRRGGDVFGNTVNIAARLQGKALPGTCLVSGSVHEAAAHCRDVRFQSVGAPPLRNIAARLELFRVVDPVAMSKPFEELALPVLSTIGALTFSAPGTTFEASANAEVAGLLGYLALCPGQSETRDRLISLLWPKAEPVEGGARLERILTSACALPSPFDVVTAGDGWVSLDKIRFNTDLELIEAELRTGRVPRVLVETPDWADRILGGAEGLSQPFGAWLAIQRKSWLLRVLRLLERIVDRGGASRGERALAADAVLLLEPGNEVASLARVNHLLAQGDRNGAQEEYDRLRVYLTEVYGTEPDPRIDSAMLSALRGRTSKPVPDVPTSGDGLRLLRISVGPFQGYTEPSDYRIQSFRSDLIANLARFRDWSVLDIPSARNVGEPGGPQSDYRIEGRAIPLLQGSGLDLSLKESLTGRALWSERFDLGAEQWDEAQQRAIRGATSRLERYISSDRLAAVLHAPPPSRTNHDKWMLGDQAMMRWTPEGADEARRIFKEILRADPDHVPSLTSLASISNIQHIVHPGRLRTQADVAEADRLASRAAALDPLDSRVQRAVAWSAAWNGAFERALLHMDRAAELNPNSPATQASCAMGYAWFGDRSKADVTLTRVLSLATDFSPWIWSYIASVQFFLGRYEDALRSAELSDDGIIDNQGWVAAIHAALGDRAAAATAFDRLLGQVAPVWAGPEPVTPASAHAWFCGAYPIRNESDKDVLKRALSLASSVAA